MTQALAPADISWPQFVSLAQEQIEQRDLGDLYKKRLKLELQEIEKQGTNLYWLEAYQANKKFPQNPNNLVLPWLLGLLENDVDPIETRKSPLILSTKYADVTAYIEEHGVLPHDVSLDSDKPDIDIDCLPEARDEIKKYAAERYGIENVASVGTWQTYLFKAALSDAARALGFSEPRIKELTKELPDDVNELKDSGFGICKHRIKDGDKERECKTRHNELKCPSCGSEETDSPTLTRLFYEHEALRKYLAEDTVGHQLVIQTAARLVGRVRNAGKHAGAIIIADRNLFGNIPMSYDSKTDQWVSLWTEGRNTQLSKLGYNKWDILGLANLKYITVCCDMVERNHGISFGEALCGLEQVNPENDQAGVYWKDGQEFIIPLNDPAALQIASESRTDAIFQFDTNLAKQTLSNGVQSFNDLMVLNAMGHPGPMAYIPEYIKRRDDTEQTWRKQEHPAIAQLLEPTHGIIVYQEQLTTLWQRIAKFTGPEAQDARKAVAKKWRDKLKPVRQKWIDGASEILGVKSATEMWDDRLEPFGRYSFNQSHALAYCLWAYRCLWLKAHFPEEWWASVLGYCKPDNAIRYIAAARTDGVIFGALDIRKLTLRPVAFTGKYAGSQSRIALGLNSLKKVGMKKAPAFADTLSEPLKEYTDIDDFVAKKGKDKIVLERLIKLGSFQHLHPNIKATWLWYQYKYCADKTIKDQVKTELLEKENWTEASVILERQRQIVAYRQLYPKRKKLPAKIEKWVPKPNDTRENVMALVKDDFTLREILDLEKEFLGYYWHSPCDLYHVSGECTIESAKIAGIIEGVIGRVDYGRTKQNKPMARVTITDGKAEALVLIWESELGIQDRTILRSDSGVRMRVNYDENRNSFTLMRNSRLERLWSKTAWEEQMADMI